MAKFVYPRCVKRRNKNIYMHRIPPSPLLLRVFSFFRPTPIPQPLTTKQQKFYQHTDAILTPAAIANCDQLWVSGSGSGLLGRRRATSISLSLAWLTELLFLSVYDKPTASLLRRQTLLYLAWKNKNPSWKMCSQGGCWRVFFRCSLILHVSSVIKQLTGIFKNLHTIKSMVSVAAFYGSQRVSHFAPILSIDK